MKITEEVFDLCTIDQKIEHLIDFNNKYFLRNFKFLNTFYVFDKARKMYGISIGNPKLLSTIDYKRLLKKILQKQIEKIEYVHDTTIIKVLFIYESWYLDKDIMDLDMDISENIDANEAVTIYTEDKFFINIKAYDCIKIKEAGKTFAVISNKPIKNINYSKLDLDDEIKGSLTNIM